MDQGRKGVPSLEVVPGIGYAVDGVGMARVTEVIGLVRLERADDPSRSPEAFDAARDQAIALSGPFARHVHAAAAAFPDAVECLPETCSGDCGGFMRQFERFCADFEPRFAAREQPVFSQVHGYAGTPDWLAAIDGALVVGDTKLGSPFPHVALQLAAYRFADFVTTPKGLPEPMPEVTGGVVLCLWPDRYELRDVSCDQRTFETFLHLLAVHRQKLQLEESAVGPPRMRAP